MHFPRTAPFRARTLFAVAALWLAPSATGGGEAQAAKKGSKRVLGAPECAYRTPVFEHEVRPGEHLGLIAGRYGVLSEDLLELNENLRENPDLIRVGESLKVCPEIPPREELVLTHVVSPGETLSRIAKLHGISVEELLAFQEDPPSPKSLQPGMKLRIETQGDIVAGFEPRPPPTTRARPKVQLPESRHWHRRRPHLAYGTERSVGLLAEIISTYRKKAGGPKVHIGDISRNGGGALDGHLSHKHGLDVDIGLVMRGEWANETRFLTANAENLDEARTWQLVREFIRSGEVRYIFLDYRVQERLYEHALATGFPRSKLDEYFQYPRGRGRNHGIVRHWPGHANHIHVRFRG